VPVHKWLFFPIPLLAAKNNPRKISHMPAVIFGGRLGLGKNPSFMDRYYLTTISVFQAIAIQFFIFSGHLPVKTVNLFFRAEKQDSWRAVLWANPTFGP
jgi:hypothetical protein